MTPDEARRALNLVSDAAVRDSLAVLASDLDILEAIPPVIAYYSDGTSALAADYYDETREAAAAAGRYRAEPIVPERDEKIRRGLLWVVKAFGEGSDSTPESRLAEVVQLEVSKPHRETITGNLQRDPRGAGWKRITRGDGCKFCRMLAAKGAIYRTEVTSRFAAHANCNCTAQPWFEGQPIGEEASALQYTASQRARTAAEKARLRDYLNGTFPDAPG